MIIRIFANDKTEDIEMETRSGFVIGSGAKDDYRIISSYINSHHVRLERTAFGWTVHCNGTVVYHGQKITSPTELKQGVYVLSHEDRISMLVLESSKESLSVPLCSHCEISVGRASGNTLVIDSMLVSSTHAVIYYRDHSLHILDTNSTNGTYLNSQRISETILKPGDEIVVGDGKIVVGEGRLSVFGDPGKIRYQGEKQLENNCSRREYHRSPRVEKRVISGEVEIEAPPNIGEKPEINWLSVLLPLLTSVGIALLMGLVLKTRAMAIYGPIMAMTGLVVSLSNHRKQKKKHEEKEQLRIDKYTEHLDKAIAAIEKKQKEQLSALNSADPDLKKCFSIVASCDRTLWERVPSDPDFASFRIGDGSVDSAVKIRIPKNGISLDSDDLRQKPQAIYNKYAKVGGAPIICHLRSAQTCGIVGKHADALALLKNVIVQFTTLHSYSETKLVLVSNEDDLRELGWALSLPHIFDKERKNRYLATSKEDAASLFDSITQILKSRKLELDNNDSYGATPQMLPYILLMITQPLFLSKSSTIIDYLFRLRDLGIGTLILVDSIAQLPKECNLIIEARDGQGYIYDKTNASHRQSFVLEKARADDYESFGRDMSLIYCEEEIKAEGIPKSYTFFQMYGISDANQIDLKSLWASSDITSSMAVPIGVAEGNKTVRLELLDLAEGTHGPHGLVAGTTGSGKSEVLQTYILSLALCFHPYEVAFLLIDFKGGGMANQFSRLPHLAGTITNLEGREIDRSLAAIKAELLKRQQLFKDHNVNHISQYIKKYRNHEVDVPLPHLIIIVDEFAELKAEQPDFMQELISVARIGRSLGFHMILATQKPAGQVSDQIMTNITFRMCLKVASREDSKEMLESAAAFSIKEPGRAYLRVNGIDELFQSGYSGAKAYDAKTQLEAVVDLIDEYCRSNNIQKLPAICQPPLKNKISFSENGYTASPGRELPIGIYDDPGKQTQGVFSLDLFDKNTMIIGTAQSGKTNLLQTAVRCIAEQYSPDEVNIYILDFASMALKNLESLCHVGGVVTSSEDEKLRNLVKLLLAEIDFRKQKLLEHGITSFSAYREAGGTDLRRIVLVIDGFSALKELYFQEDDSLLSICQNGLSYGISVIAANTQASGLGYKYLASFYSKIALFCNDPGEYSSLFNYCKMRINDIHGRGIVERDGQLYECQTFLAFDGEREIDRAQSCRLFIAETNAKHNGKRARTIPMIPESLNIETVFENYSHLMNERGRIIVGLDYDTVGPVAVDLSSIGSFAISGADTSEAQSLLGYIIKTCERRYPKSVDFYISDSIGKGLAGFKDSPAVAEYEYLPDRSAGMIAEIESALSYRYNELLRGHDSVLEESKLLVLVLCGNDVFETVSSDPQALRLYNDITSRYKNLGVCVILNELNNSSVSYTSPEIVKKARDARKLFFFDELDNLKIFDVPYSVLKSNRKKVKHGECYFIDDNECIKLKAAID